MNFYWIFTKKKMRLSVAIAMLQAVWTVLCNEENVNIPMGQYIELRLSKYNTKCRFFTTNTL